MPLRPAGARGLCTRISRYLAFFFRKTVPAERITHAAAAKDVHLRESNFHLDSDTYLWEASITTLWIFSLAALAILLLACINFMNLATAQAARRRKRGRLAQGHGSPPIGPHQAIPRGGRRAILHQHGPGRCCWPMRSCLSSCLAERQLTLASLAEPRLLFGLLAITDRAAGRQLSGAGPLGVQAGTNPEGGAGLRRARPGRPAQEPGCHPVCHDALPRSGTFIVGEQLKFMRSKDLGIDPLSRSDLLFCPQAGIPATLVLPIPGPHITHSLPPGSSREASTTCPGKEKSRPPPHVLSYDRRSRLPQNIRHQNGGRAVFLP